MEKDLRQKVQGNVLSVISPVEAPICSLLNFRANDFDQQFYSLSRTTHIDLTSRDNEIKELSADAARAKELDKVVQRQTVEVEQLKKQLSEQQQSKHMEENSKIEIRNLQNALDSSKKELEAQHANAVEFKKQVEDLKKQLAESQQLTKTNSTSGDSFLVSIEFRSDMYLILLNFNIKSFNPFQLNEKINELNANHQKIISQKETQIADMKTQIEALQKTESDLAKQIDEQKTKNNVSWRDQKKNWW